MALRGEIGFDPLVLGPPPDQPEKKNVNMRNQGLTRDQMMRGAGAYQQTHGQVAAAKALFGKEYGSPPYFGEEAITGTRVDFGFEMAPTIPDTGHRLKTPTQLWGPYR